MDPLSILALLLTRAMEFSQVMLKAQAEGREVSAGEIEEFREALMASDVELEAAIEKAKAEGR